ncbi:DUF3768 domain-containing protein [Novosphingobium sp. ST904]|jgi:hypothetical protein|uniref:DUF3768 domain-containing protein n=1 Tax=Novosphingobium sp. ST904 TaxID=1684385 RepID=UPI0006C8ADA2|nr:DUF3768 domain-containing protein [Novosphingobium sp. ST904]KPH63563.1 hypothetical protein ADT71_13040 [Novosphingobium sp. ST904]TCM32374.1 uncharacterized protein DUF3768 [Novosphingobium sp. ST904]
MLRTPADHASRTEIIGRLNDRCRLGLDRTARTVITRNCLATFSNGERMSEIVAQARILAAVRAHRFPQDDRSERDRSQVEYEGQTIYFAIDAYDLDLRYGSDDAADASLTRRVMTIMVREDL